MQKNNSNLHLWILQHFPTPLIKLILTFYEPYKRYKMPERRVSFGKLNPDKVFYVIRFYNPSAGLLALYVYVLGYMKYAIDHGYIPVIDMKNYHTVYQINGNYNDNLWEWFFEQPFDITSGKRFSLDEVYQSKNVILSCGSENFHNSSMDKDVVKWQREMVKLIPFSKNMQEYVDKMYEDIFPDRDNINVLGVPLRGTDLKKRVSQHAIQLSCNEAAVLTLKFMNKYKYNVVFCNSEEEVTIDEFSKSIPNVRHTNTIRIKDENVNGNVAFANSKSNPRVFLKDYLTNIYIMSKCDSILGTMNNGYYTAYLWNNGNYEHFELIDKGTYK